MTSADEYTDFARAHLPRSLAEKWISLLHPAVQFPHDLAPGEAPALVLGGAPLMPDGVGWPALEGYGPLSFIAELDCAAVAAVGGLDLLPTSGYLLFFCADHRYDGVDQDVDFLEQITAWTQGRALYVAPDTPRSARQAPEGLEPYGTKQHPARAVSTPPYAGHELAERYFGSEVVALMDRQVEALRFGGPAPADAICPLWAEAFEYGIHDLREGFCQTGGHSRPAQGPVELEAARDALDRRGNAQVTDVLDETEHWRVLFQTADDEDIDLMWGGGSVGYWMIREDDLAARRFDRIWFTMQN